MAGYELRRQAREGEVRVKRADLLDLLAERDELRDAVQRLEDRWHRSKAQRNRRKPKGDKS